MSNPKLKVKATGPDGDFTVSGQTAKALIALVNGGAKGVTSLEVATWAFRFAAYVHDLRKLGLSIETTREDHDGGWHGRYVLHSAVTILKTDNGKGGEA